MSLTEKRNLREGFRNLGLGSHVCSIYSDKEEQLSQVEAFIEFGLRKNQKVLYIYDERTKKEIIERLKKANIDIQKLIESGQFKFSTKRESYLKNEKFDPQRMFKLISKAEKKALSEGYSGLRGIGEMTWFFGKNPRVEKLMEYESKLSDFIHERKTTILCQYNEKKFSGENLVDVIHTHPKVAIGNSLIENHYYMPAEVFSTRIKGEVDRGYYEKVKENLVKKEVPSENEKISKSSEEDLKSLLQTLEKIEKTTA